MGAIFVGVILRIKIADPREIHSNTLIMVVFLWRLLGTASGMTPSASEPAEIDRSEYFSEWGIVVIACSYRLDLDSGVVGRCAGSY